MPGELPEHRPPATVGISLLTLVPAVVGGTETYSRALTAGLARLGTLSYHVFLPSIAPDAHGGLPHTVLRSYPASFSTAGRLRAMAKAAFLPGGIREEMRLEELSAIHFPVSVMLPRVETPPAAISIHDVQHLVLPQFFSAPRRAYLRAAYGSAVRSSRLVITISEHAKQTLAERASVPPEKIRVVYLGADVEELQPGDGEREPFLLYPANGWPHKNHRRLIEAFAIVRRRHPELRLVLTGHGLDDVPRSPGVEIRGYVTRDELVRLLRSASLLVFPSLYEGFGLPVVEAMACGCPVAAANAAALPEICGDAAELYDPRRPEAIADGILQALERREELARRGLERARRFSWDSCVLAHDAIYRELAGVPA